MGLKIGSIGFSTNQGIGLLLRSFFDVGVVTDVMTVAHGRREEHPEWFPGAGRVSSLRDSQNIERLEEWVKQLDVFLALETPFLWSLFDVCRKAGVPSFLITMFECMPDPLPTEPDYFICPSLLDWKHFPARSFFLPIPVEDTFVSRWRRREKAEVFVHNAGHGGLKGRNGTAEVLEAMEYIKSPAKLIIRSQDSLYDSANYRQVAQLTNPAHRGGQPYPDYDDETAKPPEKMAQMLVGDFPRETLYDQGDVFLFPESFNGLSLPLQEAHACGMAVMAGDRFPMNTWLPREPLIPVSGYSQDRVSPRCREFERASYDPRVIAAKIDEWYGKDIGHLSDAGKEWGEKHTWASLRSQWLGTLGMSRPGSGQVLSRRS